MGKGGIMSKRETKDTISHVDGQQSAAVINDDAAQKVAPDHFGNGVGQRQLQSEWRVGLRGCWGFLEGLGVEESRL